MKIIKDIFIGNFRVSQRFGSNPQMYSKFGMKGHNGIDFATPIGSELVCCFDEAEVVRAEDDGTGYGKHLRIWDKKQQIVAIYGHGSKLLVTVGETVKRGQLIALSGNTGFSTGPHLHFAICHVDGNCKRLNTNNGFAGWEDVFDKKNFKWETSDLKKSVSYGIPDSKKDCTKIIEGKDKEIKVLKEEIVKLKSAKAEDKLAFKSQLAELKNDCQRKMDAHNNSIIQFINSLPKK